MAVSYFNKKVKGIITPKSRSDLPNENTGKGSNYSRCTACGEIFAGPTLFDKHRRTVGRMDNYHRICVDPESVGLILGERDVWITADREPDEAS